MTELNNMSKAEKLIKGAIDMHVHTTPDLFPRLASDIEIAWEAKKAGMGGLVIKNHFTTTADRAQIASEVTAFPVFGGLALNNPTGGLNPEAVKVSLKLGAKIIWMPTVDSEERERHKEYIEMFNLASEPGTKRISLLDQSQALKKELADILELIIEHDAILATGHISKTEARILVEEAGKLGVKKIMLTHPLSPMLAYTIDEIKALINKGVSMVEFDFFSTTNAAGHPISKETIAGAIKAIGARNAVMTTDGGQRSNPGPVEMLKTFTAAMRELGITEEDIKTMVCRNPAAALDL